MHITDKARRYLDRMPPAVSGQGGHNQTFRVACVLVQGFGLSISEAYPLMLEYSARCVPTWPERDINHKLADAERVVEPKGRGYLTKGIHHTYRGAKSPQDVPGVSTPRPMPSNPSPTKPEAPRYAVEGQIEVPKPLLDGTRELILAAFREGEGIRLCIARSNEEGREVPKDGGLTLSREELLAKLDSASGDPNKFLSTSDKNGIFVSINPMKLGGSCDSDVTAYRHCLLEFDEISREEQWSIIQQSNIPATAVIYSGGKSLHAWVRIDAKDRTEYDERVKLLYHHFSAHKPDEKNKNPSRFSRLPNCVRFDSRQELLALNMGAESFSAWQMEQELDDLGQEIQIKELLEFVPEEDANQVLGKRWLCRGGSCLWIGQSGIGKSSLEMQLAILWALERPAFGIVPHKPIKSLIIQAENDLGDIAEMFQGVWEGMKFGHDIESIQRLQERIVLRKINSKTGAEFCHAARRLIDRYKPDLVWLDPVLAYIGDDISKQSVCSEFFRNGLNPIADATGVIWMIMHHTGKPPKDPKSKSGWTHGDYSYDGIGSSDLTNWARAICSISRFDDNLFELKLSKRGNRAGARDVQNNPTRSLWLKQAEQGICWHQTEAPSADEVKQTKSRYKVSGASKSKGEFDYEEFLGTIKGEHFTMNQLAQRIGKFARMSERTAWRTIIPEMKTRMIYDPVDKVYTV